MTQTDFDTLKPIVISAVIITNIVLNFIAIAVIAKYPQLREDRTTLFMFSLSLSDLACGCTAMPISAAVCSNATPHVRNIHRYLPVGQAICANWFAFVSLHSLCWLTVCKMVAIMKPLRYEQLLSRNRCYAIIAFIWFIGLLLSTSISYLADSFILSTCFFHGPSPSANQTVPVAMTVYIIFGWALPVVTTTYSNCIIFKAAIRANRQITEQLNSIGGHGGIVENNPPVTVHTIRSGKNVLVISLAVLLLTLPSASVVAVIAAGREADLPNWYKFMGIWIYMSNSSVNSLLYVTLFRSVRKKTKQMFSEFCQTVRFW